MASIRLVLFSVLLVFAALSDSFAGICDPEVVAQLKNVFSSRESSTVSSSRFDSFCSKKSSNTLSVDIGSDRGLLDQNKSIAEACLTHDVRFFDHISSETIISTLSDDVQRDLIQACSGGTGVQFSGTDRGGNLVVTARYEKPSDGTAQVAAAFVGSLSVTTQSGTSLTCVGGLVENKASITAAGVSAKCTRNGYEGEIAASLDVVDSADKSLASKSVRFSGKKIIGIRWAAPSVKKSDGRMFTCEGNDGAIHPVTSFDCHFLGTCDNNRKKQSICASSFGNAVELSPVFGSSILWVSSLKSKKNPVSDCIGAHSIPIHDMCVTAIQPIVMNSTDTQK
jgi:hypothetical protein